MPFVSVNPATGDTLAVHPSHTPEQLADELRRAAERGRAWASVPVSERADRLTRVARVLQGQSNELATLATREMGKPITQSRAEVVRCAHTLEQLAQAGPRWLTPEPRPSEARRSVVRFDPLGAILGIMPWNFPYWQIVRFAASALLAGNVVLVKPAPSTAGCALALQRAFHEAGIGCGTYTTVLAEVADVPGVIGHDAVRGVAFTGSVGAGRLVAELAGRTGKPCVLELGGSDALLVLDDADVPAAAAAAVQARCLNAGQSCIATKRLIATPGVYAAFRDAVIAGMDRLGIGDPLLETTDLGPLARFDLRDHLLDQLGRGLRQPGARQLYPNRPVALPGRGAYVAPMLIELQADDPGHLWHEEVFAPVAVLVRAKSAGHAFELAGQSRYGLGCSIWTADPEAHLAAAGRLDVGNVFFNALVRSHALLPFGGVKDSGFGRELGAEGVRQFTNVKTVWIA